MDANTSQAAREAMKATCASAESLVIGPVDKPTEPMVVFYQLGRKFVDDERSIPDGASEIMYYTLAVGHHTGVIDCFDEKLRCTLSEYEGVCALLPEGSDARYKLEGVLRSGEIQVDRDCVPVLDGPVREALAALGGLDDGVGREGGDGRSVERAWLEGFSSCLAAIKSEPAVYLMGRTRMP